MRFVRTTMMTLALAAALGLGVAHAQVVPVNKCTAAKTKCVSARAKGLLACHVKAETKGLPLDPVCTSKVTGKFTTCMAKAEAKPPCLVPGDAAALAAAGDAFVLDVVQQLDPGYPAVVLNKCSAAKKKASGAKTAAKLGCLAKAFGKTGLVDSICLGKATTKHAAAYAKAEAKPPCLTLGDEATLEATVDAFYNDMVAALSTGGGGPNCGNAINDLGEACDASAASSGWGACGPDFSCVGCNCACPTRYEVAVDANDPATVYDFGWTGLGFRERETTNGTFTVGLGGCTGSNRPCGTCNVTGMVANASGEIANRRCTNNTSIACASDAPCAGLGGTCEYYLGSWQGMPVGGVGTCVAYYQSAVTGTVNVETGNATIAGTIGMQLSISDIFHPCPRCLNDPTANDGVKGGTCNGGPLNGSLCDANGTQVGFPDFGTTSLDCSPVTTLLVGTQLAIGGLEFPITSVAGPVTETVSATSPTCGTVNGERCLCDTCNSLNAEPCQSDGDCPDPSGPIGGICGGRRCIGGTNNGAACNGARQCVGGSNDFAACTVASQCPGGTCTPFCTVTCVGGSNNGAACTTGTQCPGGFCPSMICNRRGEPTKASACIDDTMGTPGVLDCSDTAPVDGVGECTLGPTSEYCSAASGHPQLGCFVDADCGTCAGGANAGGICNASSACPGGSCTAPPPLSCEPRNRPCHLTGSGAGFGANGTGTLVAAGVLDAPVRDTADPTLGTVACVPASSIDAVNTALGLPGPLRMTRKATVTAHP